MALIASGCTANLPNLRIDEMVETGCTPKVQFNYEIMAKNPNSQSIKDIKALLEHIPDSVQSRLNTAGLKVVIYDGPLTNLKYFKYLRDRKDPTGRLWNNMEGAYSPILDIVAISQNGTDINSSYNNLPLHEITHEILEVALGQNPRYRLCDKEYLANRGAAYYYSNDTRKWMKFHNPEIYNFFERIDDTFAEKINANVASQQ